jgi:outer membrane protein TolC
VAVGSGSCLFKISSFMKKNQSILFLTFYIIVFQSSVSAQKNTLDYYIQEGLSHSPALKELNNQLSSNSIDSLLINASVKPKVSYNSLLYYAPVINGFGYSDVITNISNISSVVYVSQRIFSTKYEMARYSKIGIQNQILQNSVKLNRNELIKAIRLQYLNTASVLNELRYTRELLEIANKEEELIKQLAEQGLYKQVDYLSFRIELTTQILSSDNLKIQYLHELTVLNTLCGITNSDLEVELDLPELMPDTLILQQNSPFFTKFSLDSLLLQNEKTLIDRDYKPSFNWFSDVGLINNLPRDIGKNIGFSFGLNLSVPIYDGQQRKLNYARIRIAEDTRSNYADYYKQQFNQELRQLFQELKQNRELIPIIMDQVKMAELLVKQDGILLNKGSIPIADYIAALKNSVVVKQNFNRYQVRILQLITEINYRNQ